MLNLCVFIFVIYAVSYSAKAILFGKLGKKQKKAYCCEFSGIMRKGK